MKNKQVDHISNIMSKRHGIFLQIHEKLERCQNSNLTNSRRRSFGDDANVTFIS